MSFRWETCGRCKQLINPVEEAAHAGGLGFLHFTCLSPVEQRMLSGPRK